MRSVLAVVRGILLFGGAVAWRPQLSPVCAPADEDAHGMLAYITYLVTSNDSLAVKLQAGVLPAMDSSEVVLLSDSLNLAECRRARQA
jgi:hypothetical protein